MTEAQARAAGLTEAEIAALTLDSGDHTDPSAGHCLLEVVSLFAGEKFGDHPQCVDVGLAAFGRKINVPFELDPTPADAFVNLGTALFEFASRIQARGGDRCGRRRNRSSRLRSDLRKGRTRRQAHDRQRDAAREKRFFQFGLQDL